MTTLVMVVYACNPRGQQQKDGASHLIQTGNIHSCYKMWFNLLVGYFYYQLCSSLWIFGYLVFKKIYRVKMVSLHVSIFFSFLFIHSFFIHCVMWSLRRGLLSLFSVHSQPPMRQKSVMTSPIFSMSNPQGQLMRCLIQTQIISANPVSGETVPLPHNTFTFSSLFPSFFFLSYVFLSSCCLNFLGGKCCEMQIGFWSITINSIRFFCCLSLSKLIYSPIVVFTFSSGSVCNHSYLVTHSFACPIQRINYANQT